MVDYGKCPYCEQKLFVTILENRHLIIFDCDLCGFHDELEYDQLR